MNQKALGTLAALVFGVVAQGYPRLETPAPLELISGCWRGDVHGSVVDERWDRPEGGLMLGTSKTIKNGNASQFEFLKIQIRPSGTIYTPYINGRVVSGFAYNPKLSSSDQLVFENSKNDFPKQISYRRSASELEITLQGSPGKKMQYTLKAIDCAK